jgi:hypothetical protein
MSEMSETKCAARGFDHEGLRELDPIGSPTKWSD